ncbi:MAG TPA: SgcJ/EcaC family oxidoreductase [Propionibacteriaceae bacterium]|nr:SgcJ/EcaC family oxidoreductase [Propionibacteriaceae bacterium]
MTDYEATADQGVRPTDDQELKTLFQRLCQAWTDGNAAAYGACFTADCDYVSFDGTRARGREQVVEPHDKLFRGVLFGTALVGDVESIRYIADDVALLHGNGSVLVAWRSQLPKRRLTLNTMVAVRGPEGWRFTAIHNGRVRPVRIPEPDSMPARLARGLVVLAARANVGWAAKDPSRRTSKTPKGESIGRFQGTIGRLPGTRWGRRLT